MTIYDDYSRPFDVNYSRRILAFIDILGFADTVKRSADDQSSMELVHELLNANSKFKEFFRRVINGGYKNRFAEATFFSDTFIISMNDDKIIYVLREIGNLCRYLLMRGLACRGAVVTGYIFHDDDYIVGPALVDAYQLEQKVAINPRVLIDDESLRLWKQETVAGSATECVATIVKADTDGRSFLDIFDPAWINFLDPYNGVEWDPLPDFAENVRPAIERQLEVHSGNTRIREKYEWLDAQRRRYIAA